MMIRSAYLIDAFEQFGGDKMIGEIVQDWNT
jgi:hypothetical protein